MNYSIFLIFIYSMKIKITEAQLRKIIKSHLIDQINESELDEGLLSDFVDMIKKAGGTTLDKIKSLIKKFFSSGKEPDKKELQNLKDLNDPDFLSDNSTIQTGPKSKYRFDKIPDGNNNYRSAQLPLDLLSSVIDKYNIKTIIRFNGDNSDGKHGSDSPTSIKDERNLAKLKGVEFKTLSASRDQDKVNDLLDGGNVLIHCAHGADRTGGNVGGYLYNKGWGDTKKIWDYTTRYNDWNYLVKNGKFKYLYLAQKFGVQDMDHAMRLTK